MALLGLISEKFVKSVEFTIDTQKLNADFRKSLVELIKQYKGNTRLEIRLIDKSTGYNLGFFSKKFSIRVCQDLIDAAQRMGMICRVIK